MIKNIITDRAFLTTICVDVPIPIEDEFVDAVQNLLHTADSIKHQCAGLAAPQIGYLSRFIAVKLVDDFVIMINPEIISRKGKKKNGLEGCLSRPLTMKKPVTVKRWFKVKVRWVDIHGNFQTKIFKNFEARVVQHEIDHLNGVIIQ